MIHDWRFPGKEISDHGFHYQNGSDSSGDFVRKECNEISVGNIRDVDFRFGNSHTNMNMKKGEKYTMLISEREAGLVLTALEFALKLNELLPFSEDRKELSAAKKLCDRIKHECRKFPTELKGLDQ